MALVGMVLASDNDLDDTLLFFQFVASSVLSGDAN